ncbi:hypothetical protein GCL60_16910 (plasmid) [Silvanigrella paludirubra]|uniref:Uncharacterized protein n=1 Tax=Silvanigrella paludirubra TaxID=2499159 RepID=A0A6N6VP12_9BACT|nr:hypothetical protein [Silvanigrella paludirubra]KAB8035628.1 hypothetical protein GCL60_16910 [Silvanigrella paludirubra]
MSHFSKDIINFIDTDLKNLFIPYISNKNEINIKFSSNVNKDKLRKNIKDCINFYNQKDKLLTNELQNEFQILKRNQVLQTRLNFKINHERLLTYLKFFDSNQPIYKINDDFLSDYMNFDLDIEKILSNNIIEFSNDSIIIFAKNLLKYRNSEINIVQISKMNSNKGNYLFFSLRNINNNFILHDFFRPCNSKFDLIHAYHEIYRIDGLKNIVTDHKIELKEQNLALIKILKLMLYIQSSNVDLRKVNKEIPKDNYVRDDHIINKNYISNESSIDYFKVGYGWKKLPIYSKNEWSVKGHFRMQPCGENRRNHRIIFIEPQIRKRKIIEIETNLDTH